MNGKRALNPMGWDAFGLPAENAAIQRGVHPRDWTFANIKVMKEQFRRWGILFDWSKEIASCTPEYYRWNQWLFLRMLEKGLAYKKKAPVNWCPSCQTVLANEQVVDGACERCGTPVVQRDLEQWFFRITGYADRLLDGLDGLEGWPEKVKVMQRNWIGRSEGAEIDFQVPGAQAATVTVFTTRPDTIHGATFLVLAPEHPLVPRLIAEHPEREELEALDREGPQHPAHPARRGGHGQGGARHRPQGGEPRHRRGDPGLARQLRPARLRHGRRSWACPRTTPATSSSPARRGCRSASSTTRWSRCRPGGADRADPARGVDPRRAPVRRPGGGDRRRSASFIAWIEEKGFGRGKVTYRLRDWLISRQRYWGTPIPVVYCEK